jgi:hypothetical protein
MGIFLWWVKIIFIGICSSIFLVFGIETLIGGYALNNPLQFIMVFFAASLMILISLVGILYPLFQIHARFIRKTK